MIALYFSPISLLAVIDDNYKGRWEGIEVVGVDHHTAQKIRNKMPFKRGDVFLITDDDKYMEICQKNVNEIIPSGAARCGFTLFTDGIVYLNIDIPKAQSDNFRKIPSKNGKIAILPDELRHLYDAWNKRMSTLQSSGTFPNERYDNGFRDSDDPVLHEIALKLNKVSWKHNDNLLDIVHYSPDVSQRRVAATLLAWSRHPENLALILKWDLLMDPDIGVRNYVARAFTYSITDIRDRTLLKNLLPAYCKQVALPTHTDRNKALYSILGILKNDITLASNISPECKDTITYISEISILDNVGGVAKDINKLMGNSQKV